MKEIYCEEWKGQENYYGYVYVTLDQKHNLLYVGQKKGLVDKTENYYGSGTRIKNIKKSRGTYFLKKIVLGVCYSREELLECEYQCKCFFDVWNRVYGYNIAVRDNGGDTLSNHPNKEDIYRRSAIGNSITRQNNTKEKKLIISNNISKAQCLFRVQNPDIGLSNNLKLRNIQIKGKSFKEIYGIDVAIEIKEKISKANKGVNNPFYGKTHTNESKYIISQKNKIYQENLFQEKLNMYKKDILFLYNKKLSLKKIAKELNISDKFVTKVIKYLNLPLGRKLRGI